MVLYELLQNKRVRFALIGGGVLFLILCIILYLQRSDSFYLTETDLPDDGVSVQLIDNTIYGFNGLAFYKIPVSGGDPTILFSGRKLPYPKTIAWAGDKGVVLTFERSFIYTDVATYALKNDLSFDTERNSTWYLDFSSGKLSNISLEPVYRDLSYYSSDRNGVFFFNGHNGQTITGRLSFYSLETGQLEDFKGVEEYSNVLSLSACPTGLEFVVCFIGDRSGVTTPSLFGVSGTGLVEELFSSDGHIEPTGDKDSYLSMSAKDINQDAEEGSPVEYTKSTLRNIATKKTLSVSQPLTPGGFFANTYDDEKLVIVSGRQVGGYSVAEHGLFGPRLVTKNLDSSSVVYQSHSSNGVSLVRSTGNKLLLFSQSKSYNSNITDISDKDSLVRSCWNNIRFDTVDSQQVTFYVKDNDDFQSNIKKISRCITKEPSIIPGYIYTFSGIDPINGRITTD